MADYSLGKLEEMQPTLTGYRIEYDLVNHAMPGRETSVPARVVEVEAQLEARDGRGCHPSREYMEKHLKRIQSERREQLVAAIATIDKAVKANG